MDEESQSQGFHSQTMQFTNSQKFQQKKLELIVPPIHDQNDLINKTNQVALLQSKFKDPPRPSHGTNVFYVLHGPSGSGKRTLAAFVASKNPIQTDSDIRNSIRDSFYMGLNERLNTHQQQLSEEEQSNTTDRLGRKRPQKPAQEQQKDAANSAVGTLRELLARARSAVGDAQQ